MNYFRTQHINRVEDVVILPDSKPDCRILI